MTQSKLIKTLYIMLMLFFPIVLLAQPASGRDPDNVPIDGGLSLLVAAGVGYGAKKLKKRKHANDNVAK